MNNPFLSSLTPSSWFKAGNKLKGKGGLFLDRRKGKLERKGCLINLSSLTTALSLQMPSSCSTHSNNVLHTYTTTCTYTDKYALLNKNPIIFSLLSIQKKHCGALMTPATLTCKHVFETQRSCSLHDFITDSDAPLHYDRACPFALWSPTQLNRHLLVSTVSFRPDGQFPYC